MGQWRCRSKMEPLFLTSVTVYKFFIILDLRSLNECRGSK